jgi:hypothetical protein
VHSRDTLRCPNTLPSSLSITAVAYRWLEVLLCRSLEGTKADTNHSTAAAVVVVTRGVATAVGTPGDMAITVVAPVDMAAPMAGSSLRAVTTSRSTRPHSVDTSRHRELAVLAITAPSHTGKEN